MTANGRRVLKELGIDRHVTDKGGYEIQWEVVKNKRGRVLTILPVPTVKDIGATVAIHRSDLHTGLIGLLEGMDVRLGTTAKDILQGNDSCTVTFSDGRKETYDLVIGADGIHSSTRDRVFGTNFATHYGWRTWLYWFPSAQMHTHAEMYLGEGKLCATVGWYDTSMVWLLAHIAPDKPRPADHREQLSQLFSNFHPVVREVMRTAPQKDVYCDDLVHVDMPLWHKGRVVLVGDAQHGVSPVIGMGSSMALEDAHVLADELSKHPDDIDAALSSFAVRREQRMQKFRFIVDRMERWMMADGIVGYLRDLVLPFMPTSYFSGAAQKFIRAES